MRSEKKYGLINSLPAPPEGRTGWPWTIETNPEIYNDINYTPKISILTPSFNQGEYIEQTIRSVLLQNYPDIEYIIIDGGSSDNTIEIIKKYEKWIKYWVSEKDEGQTHAINKGMSLCTGDIFNWINSDDYYYEDCFKYLAENFTNDDTHVVAGNYRFFDENDILNNRIVEFKLRESLEETIAFVLMNQPSTFFRLDILKSLGRLDEKLDYVMDQDIWKKYLFRYGQSNIKVLDKDLTYFRFHSKSKTFQFYFNNEYKSIFLSIAKNVGMKKHTKLLKEIYSEGIKKDYNFEFKFSDDNIILAKKVINNLIFLKTRSAFSTKDFKLLDSCFSALETQWLNEYQRYYIFKLKIKSKLIKYKLSPLLKLIRSVKNNLL